MFSISLAPAEFQILVSIRGSLLGDEVKFKTIQQVESIAEFQSAEEIGRQAEREALSMWAVHYVVLPSCGARVFTS